MFTQAKRAFIDPTPRFIQREPEDGDPECECGNTFPAKRAELGFTTCLACARVAVRVANLPMHKQAYGYTTNLDELRVNCYGTHK